jgi:lipopolysaccharide assembly outer membrane protein LptD (OstA)
VSRYFDQPHAADFQRRFGNDLRAAEQLVRSGLYADSRATPVLSEHPIQEPGQIPIFDTGLADFNFAQIFADNQFSGWDRINNANQLTAAVSSRLIDPSNGSEIMRAMVGQRLLH